MAYGNWSAEAYQQYWSNNAYATDVIYRTRTDRNNNFMEVEVLGVRVRKLNSAYAFYNAASQVGAVANAWANINLKTVNADLRNATAQLFKNIVSAPATGNPSFLGSGNMGIAFNVCAQFIAGINDYNTPEQTSKMTCAFPVGKWSINNYGVLTPDMSVIATNKINSYYAKFKQEGKAAAKVQISTDNKNWHDVPMSSFSVDQAKYLDIPYIKPGVPNGQIYYLHPVTSDGNVGKMTNIFAQSLAMPTVYAASPDSSAQSSPTVSKVTQSSFQVTAPTPGTLSNYRLYVTEASDGTVVEDQRVANGMPTWNVTGLQPGTAYKVKVQLYAIYIEGASKKNMDGPWTKEIEVMTSLPPKPTVPTNLTPDIITTDSVTVSFDYVESAVHYELKLTNQKTGAFDNYVTTDSPYKILNLSPDTAYNIQIRAMDEFAQYSEWSTITAFKTLKRELAKVIVTSLTQVSGRDDQIEAVWSAISGANQYEFENITATGQTVTNSSTNWTTTSVLMKGLWPTVSYKFRCRAKDTTNNIVGPWSDWNSITIKSTKPKLIIINWSGVSNVNFTHPQIDGSSSVDGKLYYEIFETIHEKTMLYAVDINKTSAQLGALWQNDNCLVRMKIKTSTSPLTYSIPTGATPFTTKHIADFVAEGLRYVGSGEASLGVGPKVQWDALDHPYITNWEIGYASIELDSGATPIVWEGHSTNGLSSHWILNDTLTTPNEAMPGGTYLFSIRAYNESKTVLGNEILQGEWREVTFYYSPQSEVLIKFANGDVVTGKVFVMTSNKQLKVAKALYGKFNDGTIKKLR